MALPDSKNKLVALSALSALLTLADYDGMFDVMASKSNPQSSREREQCVACRKQIPPGRAGRRCEECRKTDADTEAR